MKDINKYITFVKGTLHNYSDYGIQIPMKNSRVTKTLEKVRESFGAVEASVFESPSDALNILISAHSNTFLKRVHEDQKQLVLETYELVDELGNPSKYYNQSLATRPLTDFIDRALLHVHGTYHSSVKALENEFCYHLGGGMHHAMTDHPGGFCMFNDVVSVLRTLQKSKRIENALVIDTDAHKGDGTAEMTFGDDSIRTYSIHMKNGWPLDRDFEKSHIPSDLDVGVSPKDNYLSLHRKNLEKFLKTYSGDLAVVVHGADVYEYDELESTVGIRLTQEECLKRDLITYELLKSHNTPQVWVMAGGYGEKSYLIFLQFLNEVLKRYS